MCICYYNLITYNVITYNNNINNKYSYQETPNSLLGGLREKVIFKLKPKEQ